jgi:hypothetical protein
MSVRKKHTPPRRHDRRREFAQRILDAIEKAERAGKLPGLLSANDKRRLFLELQDLCEELGFVHGAHLDWPDSPEKREQAVREWIRLGVNLFPEREILNEDDHRAYLRDAQNAVETTDRIGRDETKDLLIGTFEQTVDAFYAAWCRTWTLDTRCEKFTAYVEVFRLLVIRTCREEWADRPLAKREKKRHEQAEFRGRHPVWFNRLPLTDAAQLEGKATVWIHRARTFELKRRSKAAAVQDSGPGVSAKPVPPSLADGASTGRSGSGGASGVAPKPRKQRSLRINGPFLMKLRLEAGCSKTDFRRELNLSKTTHDKAEKGGRIDTTKAHMLVEDLNAVLRREGDNRLTVEDLILPD